MNGHHLILGELVDHVTGETLKDTHDERLRQRIAVHLMEQKGYAPEHIRPRWPLKVQAGGNRALIHIDFGIRLADKTVMIIKYGPGSLVTRHWPAIAASRLMEDYQIPLVVVTNGLQADILDGSTTALKASGMDSIPDRQTLLSQMKQIAFQTISPQQSEMASRILYAYEVDGRCPCDDTVCRL